MAKTNSKSAKSSKSVKVSKSAKATKAKKNVKVAKQKPKQKRPPLSEAEVKALLIAHPEIREFRKNSEEGRKIVRKHLSSGKVGPEAAIFAGQLKDKGLSFREIEAGMGLVHHNGMSAYRLVKRAGKIAEDANAAHKATKKEEKLAAAKAARAARKANKVAETVAVIENPVEVVAVHEVAVETVPTVAVETVAETTPAEIVDAATVEAQEMAVEMANANA